MVHRGDADFGAGREGITMMMSDEFSDAEERIVRLDREDIHRDPIVVIRTIYRNP